MAKANADTLPSLIGQFLAAIACLAFCIRAGWVGYLMYWQQPGINTDTLAPAFLALPWAAAGLLLAVAFSAAIATPLFLIKLSGKSRPLLAGLLTCVLLGLATVKLPKIAASLLPTHPRQNQPTAQHHPQPAITCQSPAPQDSQMRKSWESECR